jgi:hypothetical protein
MIDPGLNDFIEIPLKSNTSFCFFMKPPTPRNLPLTGLEDLAAISDQLQRDVERTVRCHMVLGLPRTTRKIVLPKYKMLSPTFADTAELLGM